MDLEQIKKNYERLSDEKIVHMANFESNQLEPEVVQILIDEIKKRNLSSNLVEAVKTSTKELSGQEFQKYVDLIRNLPDPTTGDVASKINATIVSMTFSVILFTRQTNKLFFGTDKSIRKKLEESTTATAIAGWWGFPFGIIYSISSLRRNSKMRKIDYETGPTEIFIQYVYENLGFIEVNKDDPKKLLEHLKEAMK
jgi:hypothetical protein